MKAYKTEKIRDKLLAERNRLDRMLKSKLPHGARKHLREARKNLSAAIEVFPVPGPQSMK